MSRLAGACLVGALALAGLVVGVSPAEASHLGDCYQNASEDPALVASNITEAACGPGGAGGADWYWESYADGSHSTTTTSSTTTTTAPPSTTTTIPAGSEECYVAGPFCEDEVGVPDGTSDDSPPPEGYYLPVNIESCATVEVGEACSTEWVGGRYEVTPGSSSKANYWELFRGSGSIEARLTRIEAGTTYPEDTGNICIARVDGDYIALDSVEFDDGFYTSTIFLDRFLLAYMWRYSGTVGGIEPEDCEANDGADVDVVFPEVDPPAVDCTREWVGINQVRITARRVNPQEGATDTMVLRVPWDPVPREGYSYLWTMPPIEEMPAEGWRGVCAMTRTVDVEEYTTTDGWKEGQTVEVVIQDYDTEEIPDNPRDESFVSAPTPTPWTPVPTAAPAPVKPLTGPGAGSLYSAAQAGWIVGGRLVGLVSDHYTWDGDHEWLCRHNSGFRDRRPDYCAALMDEPPLREQVKLEDQYGDPVTVISTEPWVSGTAVGEVLINPHRPDVGKRTTVAIAPPRTNPEDDEEMARAVDPDVGDEVAGHDDTAPPGTDQTTDPRDPDPLAAPAEPPDIDTECEMGGLFSILNPFNIAKTMSCFLQFLFSPRSDHFGHFRASWNASVGDVVGRPPAVLYASWQALDQGGAVDCLGPSVHVPGGPAWDGFDLRPLEACDGPMETAASMTRPVLLAIIWFGAILASGKLIASAFGVQVLSSAPAA